MSNPHVDAVRAAFANVPEEELRHEIDRARQAVREEMTEDLARDALVREGEKALSQPRAPHAHRPRGRNPQPA
ncbi:MAG: hypothetical protein NVSMB52_07640 [Chloroflexota bacterium]